MFDAQLRHEAGGDEWDHDRFLADEVDFEKPGG